MLVISLVCLLFMSVANMLLFPLAAGATVDPQGVSSSGVEVEVNITNLDQTIWQGKVAVDTTTFLDSKGDSHTIDHPTALGALVEASKAGGFPVEIANSAYGYYVVSINNISPQGWDGWSYKVNGESPWVGMGDQNIKNGDQVAIYYSVWPWKLTADKSTLRVDQEVVLTAYHYDSSTKTWQTTPDTSVKIGDGEYKSDQNGIVRKSFGQPGDYEVYIADGQWHNSESVLIKVLEKLPQKSTISQDELDQSAKKALDYLKNQQGEDGSIENAGVSAWAAIAFGAAGVYPGTVQKSGPSLTEYLRTYIPTPGDQPNDFSRHTTDFARQILAALASGQDPRDFSINLVDGLKGFHRGDQIGEEAYINDDVFAVLALLAAGENVDQEIISDGIRYIIDHQNTDGGFSYSVTGMSDIDTTSAAIQTLVLAKNRGFSGSSELDSVLAKAKDFLKNAQNNDGGFPYNKEGEFTDSNSATTSWAIQALIALGEDVSAWKTEDGSNPYHFLLSLQKEDGSFSWDGKGPGQNLMAAYAIVALKGRTWPVILAKTADNSIKNVQPTVSDSKEIGINTENSGNNTQQDPKDQLDNGVLPYTGFSFLFLLSGLVLILAGLKMCFARFE